MEAMKDDQKEKGMAVLLLPIDYGLEQQTIPLSFPPREGLRGWGCQETLHI